MFSSKYEEHPSSDTMTETPPCTRMANNAEFNAAESSEEICLKGKSTPLTPTKLSSTRNKIEMPRHDGKNNETGSDTTVYDRSGAIVKNAADIDECSNSYEEYSPRSNSHPSKVRIARLHFEVNTSTTPVTDCKKSGDFYQPKFITKFRSPDTLQLTETQVEWHAKGHRQMLANDLIHFLRKYDLSLKAFPITKDLAIRVSDGLLEFKTAVPSSGSSSTPKAVVSGDDVPHASTECNNFAASSSCVTQKLRAISHNRYQFTPSVFRDTPSGGFSEWKFEKTHFVQSCRSFMSKSDGVKAAAKSKVPDSCIPKSWKSQRKHRKRCRMLSTIHECNGRSQSLNNNSRRVKVSDASCSHNSFQIVPLATAFHDLETRDRAARETLEDSVSCIAEKSLGRTYFLPSMDNPSDEKMTKQSSNLRTDPVLTSAAFQMPDESDIMMLNALTSTANSVGKSKRDNDSSKDILINGNCCKPVKRSSSKSILSSNSFNISRGLSLYSAIYDFGVDNSPYKKEIQCDASSSEYTSDAAVSLATNSSCDSTSDLEIRASDEHVEQLETLRGECNMDNSELAQLCVKLDETFKSQEVVSTVKEEEKKSGEMYKEGHCAITTPPQVTVTTVEQLEESVNIDDLLESDSILNTIELADVLDAQTGSYLKYLSNDCNDFRVAAPNGFLSNGGIPVVSNHQPTRPSTVYQPAEYNAIRFSQQLQGDTTGYSSHYDVHGSTDLFSSTDEIPPNDGASVCLQNPFFYTVDVNRLSRPVQPSPTSSVSYLPMSSSTCYNLKTVGKSNVISNKRHNGRVAEHFSESYPTSKTHELSNTRYHDIMASRDISDSDSGIHSPELQSPNKYKINAGIVRNAHEYTEDSSTNYCDSRVYPSCKTYASSYDVPSTCWVKDTESIVSPQTEKAPSRPNTLECGEELWDCASTSSNATTISADAESKLLNMDEYKSFLTHETPKAVRGNGLENGYSLSVATGKEDENFETRVLNGFSAENGLAIFTANGENVQDISAGIHRSFTARMHSAPSSESLNDVSPTTETSVTFPGSSMKSVDENDVSGDMPESQHQENGIAQIAERRRTCDTPDGTSFIESYDVKIRRTSGKNVHLWEFIRDTLLNPQYCPRLIKWEDRKAGVFRFVQSDVVAGMWGEKKNNPKMTYEKLSRAMRYYYNRGILERVESRRLVYKFGDKAHGWQVPDTEHNTTRSSNSNGYEVKEEPRTDFIFPSQRPKSKKIKTCRISVSVSNDVVPDAKRRRLANEKVAKYVSISTNRNKPAETKSLTRYQGKMDEVKKSFGPTDSDEASFNESAMHSGKTFSTTQCKSPAEQPSCIVYVARPETMINQESEDETTQCNNIDIPSWQEESQENVQSKLPSADVLLGKQYKIANAVM